jgi:hypothetical protein
MNPDLMITIAFSLWVVLGWGAWAMLLVRSLRSETETPEPVLIAPPRLRRTRKTMATDAARR